MKSWNGLKQVRHGWKWMHSLGNKKRVIGIGNKVEICTIENNRQNEYSV